MREAGKGDAMRPTDHAKFSESFERIFGKKPPANVDQSLVNQVIDAANLASNSNQIKEKTNERK